MGAPKKPASSAETIEVIDIEFGSANFFVLGVTPLIFNAMSQKTKQELLFPAGRKNAAQRATSLKHNPLQEYRDSVYRRRANESGPTRLLLPATTFKAATADVAKRVPGGATTAAIKQLAWVENAYVDVYGVPELKMDVVRNSDINHTPDIRTRAILRHWACAITVRYVQPQLSSDTVGKLLSAAGMLNGVGDFRQQKGAGNFGQFTVVNPDNPEYQALIQSAGIVAQDAALEDPALFDQETEELFSWFKEELARRRDTKPSKAAGNDAEAPAEAA